jgi:lipopolysaccharide biosynthesis regulator YciM
MRKVLVLLFISVSLFSNVKQDMLDLYQNKKYAKVCNKSFKKLNRFKKDEEFVSLYGFACLKADYIDKLSIAIPLLKSSKEARSNSAYFSVILMQKKLLHHSMMDGKEISNINLPTTTHVLSKVFDMYQKLGKHKKRGYYFFDDTDNKKLNYKLYIIKNKENSAIAIEELYDSVIIKKHIFW